MAASPLTCCLNRYPSSHTEVPQEISTVARPYVTQLHTLFYSTNKPCALLARRQYPQPRSLLQRACRLFSRPKRQNLSEAATFSRDHVYLLELLHR